MKPNEILSATLIDVIFDGRNKEYGAYELRKTYSKRINKALLVTIVFAGLIFGGATLANSFRKKDRVYLVKEIAELKSIKEEIPEKLPEPERQPEPEPVRTEQFTAPEIKPDEDVTQPPPSLDDLDSAKIDLFKQEGRPDILTSELPKEIGRDKGILEAKPENTEPFTSVEIDAKFNGNWKAFLERNLNAGVATDNNAPVGRYSVIMQFVVDIDGSVSDIKALTNHGFGLEQEAIRVLKKAAKWEPAIQNGIQVKAYKRQVIIFDVLGDE